MENLTIAMEEVTIYSNVSPFSMLYLNNVLKLPKLLAFQKAMCLQKLSSRFLL